MCTSYPRVWLRVPKKDFEWGGRPVCRSNDVSFNNFVSVVVFFPHLITIRKISCRLSKNKYSLEKSLYSSWVIANAQLAMYLICAGRMLLV